MYVCAVRVYVCMYVCVCVCVCVCNVRREVQQRYSGRVPVAGVVFTTPSGVSREVLDGGVATDLLPYTPCSGIGGGDVPLTYP